MTLTAAIAAIDVSRGDSDASELKADRSDFNVLITGNLLSELKPCGCAEGLLGGLERRAAVISSFKKDKRFVLDTGTLLKKRSEQDLIKLSIIFQALSILQYDLVNLTEDDLEAAIELDLLATAFFELISSSEQADDHDIVTRFKKTATVKGKKLHITIITAKCHTEPFDNLDDYFDKQDDRLSLNILISDDCESSTMDYLEEVESIDLVICPGSTDEPVIIDKDRKKPLFVSTGKLGKYVGRLAVKIKGNELELDYSKIIIDEKLPEEPELTQLYKDYQQMVKEEKLLDRVTATPFPDGLTYLGSDTCKPCHSYEYKEWSKQKHAHAYKTLVDVGSQYDPECIQCHVVGFAIESGFINEKSDKGFRNVGCEFCHGPGSRHAEQVLSDEITPLTVDPKAACIKCHTPEHSPDYEAQEKEYRKKTVHWKEQKTSPNVQ
ncbi:MAG: cytochrome c family protein [Planctomycetes bacterium]|nr:cytochrome c family protein [Planctomycetota bacterium]